MNMVHILHRLSWYSQVLRFMYDATMSEQREVLLGNYIIQQVLSLPALSDELFVQVSSYRPLLNHSISSSELGVIECNSLGLLSFRF